MKQNSIYVTDALGKISNLARQAKLAYLSGDIAKAQDLVNTIQIKAKHIQAEIDSRKAVAS